MTISKFKVLMTTLTHNINHSFSIFTSTPSTSPFAACSVNNKRYEAEAIITKKSLFPKCFPSSDVFGVVAIVAALSALTGSLKSYDGNCNENVTLK